MASNTITTKAGICQYPWLNKPDTKFDEGGVYSVNLELSAEDAADFIAAIDEQFTEFVAGKKVELKKQNLKLHGFPWEENDGTVMFKFKVKAQGKTKKGEVFERKPRLFDAQGDALVANVGGGSKVKVCCQPYFWYTASLGAGVTLQPKAVQVLELHTYGGSSAKGFGFAAEQEDLKEDATW